jgi:hypothetical protein
MEYNQGNHNDTIPKIDVDDSFINDTNPTSTTFITDTGDEISGSKNKPQSTTVIMVI